MKECSERTAGSTYMEWFARMATDARVPISGTIELTTRCNLLCVHCYLGSLRCADHRELDAGQIVAILDEIVEAGCLRLLITGGEPLLRSDFAEVYRHARERGLLVSVFSNATLVDEAACSLFRELPPEIVDVTLYGATAATYEAVTRVPGSYARCLAGIELLLERGVRVGLKTVLLTSNVHEFHAMRAMADSYGVSFRYDAAVSAALDGDRSPVGFRLSEDEAIDLELADESRMDQWRRRYELAREIPVPDGLYGCGAGLNAFFIDATGTLYPCLMARSVSYDVSGGGFSRGWWEAMPRVRDFAAGGAAGCTTCGARVLCDVCPGFVALETGAEDGFSEFLCRIGRARREAVGLSR